MPIKNLLKPAFFKSSDADAPRAAGAMAGQAESVELIRKRAKHRLIGAAVLVLVGVVGFPLLFDTQPRPISVDIPIEIPDKASVKPLALPAQSAAVAASSASPVALAGSLGPKEELVGAKKEEKTPVAGVNTSSTAIKTEAKAEPKPEPKPAPKPEVKSETKPAPAVAAIAAAPPAPTDDGRKARALLDGKDVAAGAPAATQTVPATPAAESGRFVVQIGAFADAAKAREARLKVEKAGLKTYTQVAKTKDGDRTRVRVGPFATKEEADKAAAKIKTLDLPAAILTL